MITPLYMTILNYQLAVDEGDARKQANVLAAIKALLVEGRSAVEQIDDKYRYDIASLSMAFTTTSSSINSSLSCYSLTAVKPLLDTLISAGADPDKVTSSTPYQEIIRYEDHYEEYIDKSPKELSATLRCDDVLEYFMELKPK